MSGSSSSPGFPPLDGTLGAVEIGTGFGTLLFGIVTLQTFNYYCLFPMDPRFLKSLVAVVWFLELGHTISSWHGLYTLTVTSFGQPQFINNPPHSIQITILFSAPIYFIVQMFFAHRIRTLSGRWPITIICGVLAFARAAVIFGMFSIAINLPQLSDLAENHWGIVVASLSLGVGVDILVATSMCYYLWKLRPAGVEFTKRMVDTLIVWTIETGTVTSGCSLLLLVFFVTRPDLTWFPFYLVLAKLFSNTLLASLNGRQHFRRLDRDIINLNTGLKATTTMPSGTEQPRGVFEMSTAPHSVKDFSLTKDLETGGN